MIRTVLFLLMTGGLITLTASAAPPSFSAAQPVWAPDMEKEMNMTMGFRTVFEAPEDASITLRLTASTLYRLFLNGDFVGYGPARGPHGYYRVDAWDLSEQVRPGKNLLAIEVAGYFAKSYYTIEQDSFLQAELLAGDTVLAATGDAAQSFQAFDLRELRVQKTQRYSFQRPFMEIYRMTPETASWCSDPAYAGTTIACRPQAAKALLPRRVPYPTFELQPCQKLLSSGKLKSGIEIKRPWKDRSLTNVGEKLSGFPEADLDLVSSLELQGIQNQSRDQRNVPLRANSALDFAANSYQVLDLGANLSGFPRLKVHCEAPIRLYVTFDEMIRDDGAVDWRRLGCVNAVLYELEAGDYDLEAFEAYTLRYMKIIALDAPCVVSHAGMRLYENPDTAKARFTCANPRLQRLFEAGRSTYAQNAVDVFMDCPHRERAGWLCDSFFTARTAMSLSGNTLVEKNFVENFLLPAEFKGLPKGMLPMCYPADHRDGVFIPNWALWFVVELGEYLERSGDTDLVKALEPRVMALFDYFKPFENSDGLLEKLESWVFVEWSKANQFVQDVNYPSNMLYAGALSTAAKLYQRPELEAKAKAIREVVLKQSFTGEFFVDNAKRVGDSLKVTKNHSEVCQYFAFFFGLASPESHGALWAKLRDEFGPKRGETKKYPQVHPANSFIGNMLRVELLSGQGLSQQILNESIDYLWYMAERNDTLWENVNDGASLNHGFASHICVTLYRDVLGLYQIDSLAKEITLRFAALELPWCSGQIPVGTERIRLNWRKEKDTIYYHLESPVDYTVNIENLSGCALVKE